MILTFNNPVCNIDIKKLRTSASRFIDLTNIVVSPVLEKTKTHAFKSITYNSFTPLYSSVDGRSEIMLGL